MFSPGIGGLPASQRLEDPGRLGVGYLYLTGVVSDTETVTINGRVYEFDTDATSTGDVAVDVSADQTADAAATALVSAINGDSGRSVEAAVDPTMGNSDTASIVAFHGVNVDGSNFAISDTCANGTVSAASLQGASLPIARKLIAGLYVVTAQDVTVFAAGRLIKAGGFPTTSSPSLQSVHAVTPTTGAMIAVPTFAAVQTASNYWGLWLGDGSAALSANDQVYFSYWVEA